MDCASLLPLSWAGFHAESLGGAMEGARGFFQKVWKEDLNLEDFQGVGFVRFLRVCVDWRIEELHHVRLIEDRNMEHGVWTFEWKTES